MDESLLIGLIEFVSILILPALLLARSVDKDRHGQHFKSKQRK